MSTTNFNEINDVTIVERYDEDGHVYYEFNFGLEDSDF